MRAQKLNQLGFLITQQQHAHMSGIYSRSLDLFHPGEDVQMSNRRGLSQK